MTPPLIEALGLKDVPRAGWLRVGIDRPESVAAHSWGVALLAILLTPEHLDRERVLTFAILHDLAECETGDLTPYDGVPPDVRHRQEAGAIKRLSAGLPNGEALRSAWYAYEAQDSPEARFVRELDRLDMALQAARYGAGRPDAPTFHEFLRSAERVVQDPALVDAFTAAAHQLAYETAASTTP